MFSILQSDFSQGIDGGIVGLVSSYGRLTKRIVSAARGRTCLRSSDWLFIHFLISYLYHFENPYDGEC